jgi:hypothetical protein
LKLRVLKRRRNRAMAHIRLIVKRAGGEDRELPPAHRPALDRFLDAELAFRTAYDRVSSRRGRRLMRLTETLLEKYG